MLPVSVIVPAYNAEDTLSEAIGSLQAQTVRHWEAIIVDDGSTDATAEIAARFAALDRRISLIRQPNGGASAARNAGIEAARHDWLVFLDADDWLARNYLKHMLRPLRRDPELDGVFCRAVQVAEDGVQTTAYAPPARDHAFPVAARTCEVAIHAAVLRGRLLRSIGLFDVSLTTGEDWDLWQRVARTRASFAVLDEVLAYVRARQASLSRLDIGRLTAEGVEVIRRGHSYDPRVPAPDPRWAEGEPAEQLPQALYNFVCWCAGAKISRGGDGRCLLDQLSNVDVLFLEPAALAIHLSSGMLHQTCRPINELANLWPAVDSSLEAFLVALEQRAGLPGLGRCVRRRVVHYILSEADLDQPITIGDTCGVPIDLAAGIHDIGVPDGVDRAVCVLGVRGDRAASLVLPVRNRVIPAAALRRAIILDAGAGPHLLLQSLLRPGWQAARLWARVALLVLSRRGRDFLLSFGQASARAQRERVRAFLLSTAREVVRDWELLEPDARAGSASHAAARGPSRHAAGGAGAAGAGEAAQEPSAAAYWEAIFAEQDPWRYTSDYEQIKYRQALELLPQARRLRRALELACAEGHFTVQLATQVRQLVATDISTTALDRARQRCGGFDNITFQQLDLRCDPFPGRFDLIVCSEILYYLERRHEIRRLGHRLSEHLEPGGWLLMAHANVAFEDPDRTGFDWGHSIGARGVGEVFKRLPLLRLVRELRTPLYRIHLFQRATDRDQRACPPEVIELPVTGKLDSKVSSQVLWNGALARRRHEVTERLPILMYHRIASEGPAALARFRVAPQQLERQLQYLQRQGYYGVDLETWREATETARGLPGRAVMITFDDAYLDFLITAWPILGQYGFPIMVFVVADHVGGCAKWDRAYGEPAPLMSWSDLRHLADQGVRFGSHGLDHRPLSALPANEILHQGARSREIIEERLGRAVDAIAYPYGEYDALVQRSMRECGYRFGMTTAPGHCSLSTHPMALSRIEITGHDDLDDFTAKLGPADLYNPLRVLRNGLFDGINSLRKLAWPA